MMVNCAIKTRPRRAFGKRPENQKESQAGHSPERTVEEGTKPSWGPDAQAPRRG